MEDCKHENLNVYVATTHLYVLGLKQDGSRQKIFEDVSDHDHLYDGDTVEEVECRDCGSQLDKDEYEAQGVLMDE